MEYDKDRVDDMVLALLYLTSSQDEYAARAWKGMWNWGQILSFDILRYV